MQQFERETKQRRGKPTEVYKSTDHTSSANASGEKLENPRYGKTRKMVVVVGG
jgi:hypothetical protein